MPNSVQDELSRLYNISVIPNPFSDETRIHFVLPEGNNVSLKVVNIMGQVVGLLADNEYYGGGEHVIKWNPGRLESGVYFYVINIGGFSEMKQMILTR
jgi:hypothetical protein